MLRILIGLGTGCLCALASMVAACERSVVTGEERTLEPNGSFDQTLISRLILEEVNEERCAIGLERLEDDESLIRVSADHSAWMAAAAILSHDSNVKGRETLRDKLVASTFPYRAGAENIAYVSFYDFDGSPFYVEEGQCAFTNATTGQPVSRHTYASLAQRFVQNWMNSPGHRQNIERPDMDYAGAGIALDGGGPHCGQIYATHIFAERR